MKIAEQIRWIVCLPLTVIALAVISPIIALKVPSIICERMRRVQWLATIGVAYWLLLGTITCLTVNFASAIAVVVFGFWAGDWLLPSPGAFIFYPRHRRAIYLAIMAQEEAGDILPIYCRVRVIGCDDVQCIVEVPYSGSIRPTPRRFFSVSHNSNTVKGLTFDYVHTNWGVRAMY